MKPHFRRVLSFIAVLAVPLLAPAQTETAPLSDPEASSAEVREIPLLTAEQLDELLGPIALYPDALIAILLPASTMPTDLVLASRYIGAGGDVSKVDAQPWDESVRALARYPEVVKWMDDKLSWSILVGDAFIAQPVDVMQSIQRLRARARAAGTLVDSAEQKVVEDEGNIRIVPAQPEVIYVPVYDPQVVYVTRPVYSTGWYSPVISYRWCYPTGIWLSYDCDWYSWRVWCVNSHWRHDWYHSRRWYAPHPRHYYRDHDYGRGWSPRRGGGHPDSRRGGRDGSSHVVIRDGHRDTRYAPDFGGARGGDRVNGGHYVPDRGNGSDRGGSRGPGRSDDRDHIDDRRDGRGNPGGEYANGRNGGRGNPGGDRGGRGDDTARPRPPAPDDSTRTPPVARETRPSPQPGRWIDRATNPGNPPPVRADTPRARPAPSTPNDTPATRAPSVEPSRSRPSPSTPRVVTRPETPSSAPVVRSPEPSNNPAPRPGRWVDRATNPGNPPAARTESPRSRPAPSAPSVAPAPRPTAPERAAVVRVPTAGGGTRSVTVSSPPAAERSSQSSAPRAERPSPRSGRGGDQGDRGGDRPSGRRNINDG